MSPCPYCQQPMSEISTTSCIFSEVQVNGKWHKRRFVSFGGESLKTRCRECGITIGPDNYHHYGCENEECPECYRRIVSCVCMKTKLRNKEGDIVTIGM